MSDVTTAINLIQDFNKPSGDNKQLASLITELLSCDIPVLSQDEICQILEMLCTQWSQTKSDWLLLMV